ncbi:MAG: translation elongation factor Ts, partial [bacterium]
MVTTEQIKELRDATGISIMQCRKALEDTNGDMEKATIILRKKGADIASKKADRSLNAGRIAAYVYSSGQAGAILELSCETDFVSKNAEFVAFAQSIADAAVANNVKSAEELNEVSVNGTKVSDMINDKLASIGEKIAVAKFERVDAAFVSSYIHGAYRMGVLVGLTSEAAEVGKDLAMQIAAMNPVAVDPESVPAETVVRERAIIIDTMKEDPKMAGKPDEMIAKIAEGKINAFFKEQTLLAQAFVKDGSKTVGD